MGAFGVFLVSLLKALLAFFMEQNAPTPTDAATPNELRQRFQKRLRGLPPPP